MPVGALQQEIALYRRKGTGILASAEQTLNVSFADYRTGKVDSLTVLGNYTQLLFFRVQVVRLEATLGQVRASLERAVGLLEPNGTLSLPTPLIHP
jgi:outer membrane protein TolC